ncbi:DUF2971 domain-containing protein [Pseudomonas fragi]|uniref:DUF2971 domain-containing protein n=1 Tax=Pseudomonas fragi TaxID=296 RepID=UPI0028E60CBB|nr:DUF2971 domain-containing protein [Pseudomonas fragi]
MRIFHYTDASAAKSILEHEQMWLTDVRYLNDSEEMINGISMLVGYMKHRIKNFPHPHKFFEDAANYVENGLVGKAGYGIDNRPVFIGSFSQAGNLLSQWRAYGSYAIEFDTDHVPQELFRCVYDDDEKLDQASGKVLLSLITIAKDMAANSGFLDQEGYEAFSEIIELVATFKHESFSEEQEVRVVLGHDIDPEIESGLDVEFRTRGNILIPYVKASLPLESVRAIHVGPMRDQELAYISMKALVEKLHLKREVTIHNFQHKIEVIKSSIPYRAP